MAKWICHVDTFSLPCDVYECEDCGAKLFYYPTVEKVPPPSHCPLCRPSSTMYLMDDVTDEVSTQPPYTRSVTCMVCGEALSGKRRGAKTCSDKCRKALSRTNAQELLGKS